MNNQHVEGWGVIHMYTREQAIADGQLVRCKRYARGERGRVPRSGLPDKRAGEKQLVPFEVIYQTDPRRSSTVTLWLCFSEFEGFTILLPEEY